MRTNLFHIVLSAFFLTIGTLFSYGQETKSKNKTLSVRNGAQKSTTNQSNKALREELVLEKKVVLVDTVKVDSIKKFKSILDGKVRYKADKYAKFNQKQNILTLYDKAELYYQDYELKAGIIVFDMKKNEVYAGRLKDSAGKYAQYPNFKQGNNVVEPDSIRFNTVTKKALVWNSRTEQGDMRVKAEITKKENDSVYYMKRARFTTAKDIDDPEYYFITESAKFVPGKKVIVGPTNMVIGGVPTPLMLPFAFFPLTETSRSGIIIPSYGQSNQRGYSLQNGGYYFALGEKYDLAVLGDYYTNGSYGMRFESSYASRYNYNGNINIRFENLITSERGLPDYAKSKIYNIQWSHTKDQKSNPNSRFSASVNLGSSTYFRQSVNNINVGASLNNSLSSSVSYSKTFQTIPQINLSLTATHSQNTQTKVINMTLPTLQVSVDRIFPFAGANENKKGFIKNINFQYNLRGENQILTNDSLFFKSEMFRDAKTAFQHSIPISTNFKVFKYFSVTSSASYNEVWTLNTIKKGFSTETGKVEDTRLNGFDTFRTYNFSNSVTTNIYGTVNFGETKKIQAIRHVMRPSVSHTYAPSFAKYYDTYATDGTGTRFQEYTRFDGGVFGSPGKNYSNSVGFSINNTFEAKVRDKDSTKTEPKKIMLLNNLNFDTSYDLAADSLRIAPPRLSAGTAFFDQKLNLNFAATLDVYALDNNNTRVDKLNIDNGGSLFRLTSSNITMNYAFASTEIGKKKNKQNVRNGGREDDLFGTNTDLADSRDNQFAKEDDDGLEKDTSGFFNTKLPFDLNFAYALTYSNASRENRIVGNSVMVSANTDLTPKWKIGISTGYDFIQNGVTFTQLRFQRDLLSWRMDFNWVPFGNNAYWGFFIGIKSGILSDIKYDKQNQPNRVLR